jgi:hypothetical protein
MHAITIFLGALLVFAVQPLLGKVLLPWFGGSATVWTTCLMFFQVGLLGGYAYAHGISRWLAPRWQAGLHVGLLAVSLALLPVLPRAEVWKPAAGAWPTGWILLLLAANVGLPFVLLSATTPLATRWFSSAHGRASPYRLYALSNAGSLLGLIAYPFVIEPLWNVGAQSTAWSWGYLLFAACACCCALGRCRTPSVTGAPSDNGQPRRAADGQPGGETAPLAGALGSRDPSGSRDITVAQTTTAQGKRDLRRSDVLLWLALAACGSVMLLATTNQLCQEVAVVPLLWVLPLVVYLGTFIVTFSAGGYRRGLWTTLLALLMLPTCALLYAGPRTPLGLQIAGYTLALLAVGMCCHGELARSQPPARHITLYYLCIAAGGAIGGTLVALVAPLVFKGYWEYHLGLLAACVLTAIAAQRNGGWDFRRQPALRQGVGIGLVTLVIVLAGEMYYGQLNATQAVRNFYGVLRIVEGTDAVGPYRRMVHGRIDHGRQYQGDDRRRWPTLYFGRGSGIDLAMRLHPRRVGHGFNVPDNTASSPPRPLHVGVIGLGTGTIAAHGQRGDVIRYYEINPAVVELCRRHFTFLEDAEGAGTEVQIALGDARLSLEAELNETGPRQFDVLAVDAFRNDAIPIHLLTEECGDAYFRHIRPDGLLVLHISNNFLDLTAVARGLAQRFDRTAIRLVGGDDPSRGARAGVWVIVTSNQQFLEAVAARTSDWTDADPPPVVWTDDFAALLQVVK